MDITTGTLLLIPLVSAATVLLFFRRNGKIASYISVAAAGAILLLSLQIIFSESASADSELGDAILDSGVTWLEIVDFKVVADFQIDDPEAKKESKALLFVVSGTLKPVDDFTGLTGSCVISPTLDVESGVGSTLTIPSFESDFSTSSPSPIIPEIDIKIESIAVTAATRKLRARWSPELAQDLNAYHSLDAEVELTQILSEQIALELDREILNDLLTQAQGANYLSLIHI